MLENTVRKVLSKLYYQWAGKNPEQITRLAGAGSNRQFYRLGTIENPAIGVVGKIRRENEAFIYLCRHFQSKGIAVPEILAYDSGHGIYLLHDLGDTSLFSMVASRPDPTIITPRLRSHYRQVLEDLVSFQVEGNKGLDYTQCFPVPSFNRQAMQWDLNYFKYYALKTLPVKFDEYLLEKDFGILMDYLEEAGQGFFMYRDFQARNIFIHNDKPWYIDFQGGRQGLPQYDVASLLFQARADLPEDFREEMLDHYLHHLSKVYKFDKKLFVAYYYGFVLLRTLQVLGAYGFRGRIEQKPHFIASIPFALKNLRWILNHIHLPIAIPELTTVLHQIAGQEEEKPHEGLLMEINSFSFIHYGYPKDTSGHGGGFVFDCRALPNPGRFQEYKTLTGKDKEVIEFLEKKPEINKFRKNVFEIVDQAVDNYLERGFEHLSINFGCTGGQHRSVYLAEQLNEHLKQRSPISINLQHRMLDE